MVFASLFFREFEGFSKDRQITEAYVLNNISVGLKNLFGEVRLNIFLRTNNPIVAISLGNVTLRHLIVVNKKVRQQATSTCNSKRFTFKKRKMQQRTFPTCCTLYAHPFSEPPNSKHVRRIRKKG